MQKKYANPFNTRVRVDTDVDYVKDGVLTMGADARSVMVTSESDLSGLTDLTPGSIAYTAGFASMWQLAANGNWVALGGCEDGC